jgi:hypothetical protein
MLTVLTVTYDDIVVKICLVHYFFLELLHSSLRFNDWLTNASIKVGLSDSEGVKQYWMKLSRQAE